MIWFKGCVSGFKTGIRLDEELAVDGVVVLDDDDGVLFVGGSEDVFGYSFEDDMV